jgi:hypothetical protein
MFMMMVMKRIYNYVSRHISTIILKNKKEDEIDWIELAENKAKEKNEVPEISDFTTFLAACFYMCTPGSYGSKIQNRVMEDYGFETIDKNLNSGDFKVTDTTKFSLFKFDVGDEIEFKATFLTKKNNWNLLQLRPYQSFKYYMFLLINPFEKCKHEWFVINKNEFGQVFPKLGGCHGTKESNKENKNSDNRLTVNKKAYEKLKQLNKI